MKTVSRMGLLRLPLWLAAAAAVFLAAGCGEKKKERVETQVAASVDGHDITVAQINLVLQQQRNLRPEQADAASRQVLERLIDQSLAVKQAELDREPRVRQLIEAATREIVARAYAEKVGEKAVRPTPEEVSAYYRSKPALFAERRIYTIQELAIEARPDQMPVLRERLESSKSIGEFVDHLKANDFRFAGNQAVRAAEQLPSNVLDSLSKLNDGQATIHQGANGVLVTVLAGSRSQPVSEAQARSAIELYLLNERKRKLVEGEIKSLRGSAKVDYQGRFADGPRPGSPAAGDAAEAASAPGLGLN
jgi:EpsD family peptidyl-prolyl cis-trans isomerase